MSYVKSSIDNLALNPSGIYLLGVPYPGYQVSKVLPQRNQQSQFLKFIHHANNLMEIIASRAGWGFIDVYAKSKFTTQDQKNEFRIDDFHLSPSFYTTMFDMVKARSNVGIET